MEEESVILTKNEVTMTKTFSLKQHNQGQTPVYVVTT